MNFQMFKLDLEKAQELETKLPTSTGSSKKQESSRKKSTSALLTVPKAFGCVDQKKKKKKTVENSEKVWEYQITWPASWDICIQVY